MQLQLNARPLRDRVDQSEGEGEGEGENDNEPPQQSAIFELIVPVDKANDQR
jgi:hypothetical protein